MEQSLYERLDSQLLEKLRKLTDGQVNRFVNAQDVVGAMTIGRPSTTLSFVIPEGIATVSIPQHTLRLVDMGEVGAAFIEASILRLVVAKSVERRRATDGQLELALAEKR